MRGGITVGNLINAAFNFGFGFRSYKPKIFLIGFNEFVDGMDESI
jgi:hypothetical protein